MKHSLVFYIKFFILLNFIIYSELTRVSAPTSPSNLSTVTLVGSDNADNSGAKPVDPEASSSSSGEREKDKDDGKSDSNSDSTKPREPLLATEITVTLDSSENDSKKEDESRIIRRGSMKLLREVESKDVEPIRRMSMQEPNKSNDEKPKRKDTLKIFQRDSRKTSCLKKDKPEAKNEERPLSRFSDGFLSIDSKLRRARSKSAERRARILTKRKNSEGGMVVSEVKRKGSDGPSREGSLKSKRKGSEGSTREQFEERSWPRGWGSKRNSSSSSPHGRLTDVEFSDESGSEWATTARSASITTTNSVLQVCFVDFFFNFIWVNFFRVIILEGDEIRTRPLGVRPTGRAFSTILLKIQARLVLSLHRSDNRNAGTCLLLAAYARCFMVAVHSK